MSWKECSVKDQRLEFVLLASQQNAKLAVLARRFGISRKTGYKWLKRYQQEGLSGLIDQSRRPHTTPQRTPDSMEQAVLVLRGKNKDWGSRKIRQQLSTARAQKQKMIEDVPMPSSVRIPASSTITRILARYDKIEKEASEAHTPLCRFTYPHPNDLWQMDFKGDIVLGDRTRSHPLTILDDCSRFNLCLQSCVNQQYDTVYPQLQSVFRRFGLPLAMLMDNGSPWAHSHSALTRLELWLLRLGVRVHHGRPYHPQTQGKIERFHRTLKTEVLNGRRFPHARALQDAFDHWQPVYNYQRPHDALGLETPGMRYHVSERPYPELLPPVEYDQTDIVRTVRTTGYIHFLNQSWYIGETLGGEHIALRPCVEEGLFTVCYGAFAIGTLDVAQRAQTPYGQIRMHRSLRQIGTCGYPFGHEDM